MEELVNKLDAELARMHQTIGMVRVLKPINRQTDTLTGMLKDHVVELMDIFAQVKKDDTGSAGSGSQGAGQQTAGK